MKDPIIGKRYIRVVVKEKDDVHSFSQDPNPQIYQDQDGKHRATPEEVLDFV
jgi:hypothetical protein